MKLVTCCGQPKSHALSKRVSGGRAGEGQRKDQLDLLSGRRKREQAKH